MTNNDPPAPVLEPVNLETIGDCRVLRNVHDQPGIDTVEGTMVPLLTGQAIRSHIIVMHPGQYCDAHPHETESIIFTVSGRWVFCTHENGEEVRTVINQNDLFHFPGGVPTGFETPFDEPAVILIVKSGDETYQEMAAGIDRARVMMEKAASDGEPFYYRDLDPDHPARVYARDVSGRDPVDAAP